MSVDKSAISPSTGTGQTIKPVQAGAVAGASNPASKGNSPIAASNALQISHFNPPPGLFTTENPGTQEIDHGALARVGQKELNPINWGNTTQSADPYIIQYLSARALSPELRQLLAEATTKAIQDEENSSKKTKKKEGDVEATLDKLRGAIKVEGGGDELLRPIAEMLKDNPERLEELLNAGLTIKKVGHIPGTAADGTSAVAAYAQGDDEIVTTTNNESTIKHEFAHIMDANDSNGNADGIIKVPGWSQEKIQAALDEWKAVLAGPSKSDIELQKYGTSNDAEALAVGFQQKDGILEKYSPKMAEYKDAVLASKENQETEETTTETDNNQVLLAYMSKMQQLGAIMQAMNMQALQSFGFRAPPIMPNFRSFSSQNNVNPNV